MGKHSTNDGHGKNRRIAAAAALILAVATVIALGSLGHKPADTTAGGGNTGNQIPVNQALLGPGNEDHHLKAMP